MKRGLKGVAASSLLITPFKSLNEKRIESVLASLSPWAMAPGLNEKRIESIMSKALASPPSPASMKRGLKVAIAPLFIFFTNRMPQWKEDWKFLPFSRSQIQSLFASMKRGLKDLFLAKVIYFTLHEASMKRGLKVPFVFSKRALRIGLPQWKEDWKELAFQAC